MSDMEQIFVCVMISMKARVRMRASIFVLSGSCQQAMYDEQ